MDALKIGKKNTNVMSSKIFDYLFAIYSIEILVWNEEKTLEKVKGFAKV